MNKLRFFLSLFLAVSILIVQVGGVFAAPATQAFPPIRGTIQGITLDTDPNTGLTTVLITILDENQNSQVVRVSRESALKRLKIIGLSADGNPIINNQALGNSIEIDLHMVIPNQAEAQHPVGSALANFFSDALGVDYEAMYETIVSAHEGDFGQSEGFETGEGFGFGVIAQALWMTKELNSDSDVETFHDLLLIKQKNDYTSIVLEDGTSPKDWGQLRKAILDGIKVKGLGSVMSNKDNSGNGNQQEKHKDNNKDKNKDKNDNGSGNDNNSDKEKEKNK